jgi:hypothetical protein
LARETCCRSHHPCFTLCACLSCAGCLPEGAARAEALPGRPPHHRRPTIGQNRRTGPPRAACHRRRCCVRPSSQRSPCSQTHPYHSANCHTGRGFRHRLPKGATGWKMEDSKACYGVLMRMIRAIFWQPPCLSCPLMYNRFRAWLNRLSRT